MPERRPEGYDWVEHRKKLERRFPGIGAEIDEVVAAIENRHAEQRGYDRAISDVAKALREHEDSGDNDVLADFIERKFPAGSPDA